MAVTTTGSTVLGTIPGLKKHLGGGIVELTHVNGDPDGVVTCVQASGIAVDVTNENYYMSKVAGGSTWFTLGSTT